MPEIDEDEIAKIVGHDEEGEFLRKQVSIIKDKLQYSIRIPKNFVKLADIDATKDDFEFVLVPIETTDGEKFTIEGHLKRG